MKKLSPNSYFLILVIIVMAVFFITSLGYAELQVKLMPLLMSGFTVLLSLIALVQNVKSGSKASMPTDEDGDVIEEDEKKRTPLGDYFKAFGWFAALIAGVYFFGFIFATPVWMFVYLWKNGTQWWKGIALGVGLIIVIYVIFTVMLRIHLYQGLASEWLMSQLGL
ncbi:MAG: tripartite tricarboxylate transporter TctB family protein [Deltaproteobacteria bacterium]|nr:tripartite tricarboxylate transporter TctB family protein [Deltaproteobacteria bacterium]